MELSVLDDDTTVPWEQVKKELGLGDLSHLKPGVVIGGGTKIYQIVSTSLPRSVRVKILYHEDQTPKVGRTAAFDINPYGLRVLDAGLIQERIDRWKQVATDLGIQLP